MTMKKYLEKLKSTDWSWLLWKTKGGSSGSPESGVDHHSERRRKAISLTVWVLIGVLLLVFLSVGIYFIVADAPPADADGTKPVSPDCKKNWSECASATRPSPFPLDLIELLAEKVAVQKCNKAAHDCTHREYVSGDVKVLRSIVEKEMARQTNQEEWHASESSPVHPCTEDTPEATTLQDEDPNLVVRFDYVDLSSEDIPADEHFIDNVLAPNNTASARETIIILKNDDSGKKIFLRTSSVFPSPAEEEKGDRESVKNETTTPKAFVYSPTIPQAIPKKLRVDATTKRYNHSEASGCFSTKIPFCEGILRYDVVQLPNFLGIDRYSDLTAFLPYFQMIVDSGCSPRAREFICSVLEPECQPEGFKQRLPCKLNCKEDCKGYIVETLPPSKIFDCRRYPDWSESEDCVNIFKGKCHEDEFKCSDGTCIPLKWVCDGVHDCPGSRPSFDESNCQGCSENEFRCVLDGKCVPLHWKCDGQIDCVDHSDEVSC